MDRESVAQHLTNLSRAWSDAVGRGDMEAVLSYWVDDALFIVPARQPDRSWKNVVDMWNADPTPWAQPE